MDATRPAGFGRRFYVICESDRTFRAVSAGHGSGRNLKGIANFANGIRCAKNFSNAQDSKLTTGGDYVTSETRTYFKGYYRASGKSVPLVRSFVQFDGEGDTANARPRAIGGHPAVLLRGVCLWKAPKSPYANDDGYVPFGTLVNYAAGRSNGCTSWTPSDAAQIIPMVKDEPTTLYIYPEVTRHRGDRASGEGRPVAVARGALLERLLLERNRHPEILAEGNPRADPRPIQEGSSGAAAAADADLQGPVRFVSTTCAASTASSMTSPDTIRVGMRVEMCNLMLCHARESGHPVTIGVSSEGTAYWIARSSRAMTRIGSSRNLSPPTNPPLHSAPPRPLKGRHREARVEAGRGAAPAGSVRNRTPGRRRGSARVHYEALPGAG